MRTVPDFLAVALGTGLGVGYLPWAPGTAGTLFPGLALAFLVAGTGWLPPLLLGGALFLLGCWSGGACERHFGRRDPPAVVIDEVAAFVLIAAGLDRDWRRLLLAFVLFRIADIAKPWPASWIQRKVNGGPGIMLDDLAAALYARAAVEATIHLGLL